MNLRPYINTADLCSDFGIPVALRPDAVNRILSVVAEVLTDLQMSVVEENVPPVEALVAELEGREPAKTAYVLPPEWVNLPDPRRYANSSKMSPQLRELLVSGRRAGIITEQAAPHLTEWWSASAEYPLDQVIYQPSTRTHVLFSSTVFEPPTTKKQAPREYTQQLFAAAAASQRDRAETLIPEVFNRIPRDRGTRIRHNYRFIKISAAGQPQIEPNEYPADTRGDRALTIDTLSWRTIMHVLRVDHRWFVSVCAAGDRQYWVLRSPFWVLIQQLPCNSDGEFTATEDDPNYTAAQAEHRCPQEDTPC